MSVPWREAEGDPVAVALAERAERFDLAVPPLLRAALVRGTGRSWLVLTMHHIATDGWSVPVMIRELLAMHAGERLPRPCPTATT